MPIKNAKRMGIYRTRAYRVRCAGRSVAMLIALGLPLCEAIVASADAMHVSVAEALEGWVSS